MQFFDTARGAALPEPSLLPQYAVALTRST